jgi:hypothetical protein
MKKSIMTISILTSGFLIGTTVMTSCSQKKGEKQEQSEKDEEEEENEHEEAEEHEHQAKSDSTATAYACSMHPEVTGKEGDKCSKCGMKLEAVKAKDEKN